VETPLAKAEGDLVVKSPLVDKDYFAELLVAWLAVAAAVAAAAAAAVVVTVAVVAADLVAAVAAVALTVSVLFHKYKKQL